MNKWIQQFITKEGDYLAAHQELNYETAGMSSDMNSAMNKAHNLTTKNSYTAFDNFRLLNLPV